MAAVATTIGLSSTTSGFWQSVDSTTNARYFNIGFMYQTGFDEYKTACAADITCDWRLWRGFDVMLFVVQYVDNGTTMSTAGY